MHIALFGATGGTGRQIALQALVSDHSVTVLVRDPARLDLNHERLHVVTGDVLNFSDVSKVVSDADAVIVSLGKTSNNPATVVSQGTEQIIDAMRQAEVRRLLVISSLGVGDSRDQVPWFFKILAKSALRSTMADKERQEAAVRASGLDWTIIRPGGLTDGPATGSYQSGLDPSIVANQVSRADVAAFSLAQLNDNQYLHATPAIT